MADDMEQVYKEHAKSVYKYLFSLSHNEDIAEELTQETFCRALYSIKSYDGTCKMSVWLCQIAKHIWYQELEKRRKQHSQELKEDIPSTEMSPEETALFQGDKLSIYKAISLLDTPMREVVYMRISGELSFYEIGEVLNKSETWARVTFYRAKSKIKEEL